MSDNNKNENNMKNTAKDSRPPLPPTQDVTTRVGEFFELIGEKKKKNN